MSEVSHARRAYIAAVVKERWVRSRLIWHLKKGERAKKLRRALIRARRARKATRYHYLHLKAQNTPRARAIKYANSLLGHREYPAGSNGGPYISGWQKSFGFGRVPWCGIFVGVILRHVGVKVTSRVALVAFIEDDAKAGRNGFKRWHSGGRDGAAGDVLVLFGHGIHTEFGVSNRPDLGGWYTDGGNTSKTGSQSNGGMSCRQFRSYSQIRGIAVPDYPH